MNLKDKEPRTVEAPIWKARKTSKMETGKIAARRTICQKK